MVNYFGFNTLDAVMGLLTFSFMGLVFGFIIGLVKFLTFAFFEKKINWSTWGKYQVERY
jgi:NhaP-type Na+/H+ or K+/H+ antiporter